MISRFFVSALLAVLSCAALAQPVVPGNGSCPAGASCTVSGAWTFTGPVTAGSITASSYNGNYSVAGPPGQYGENNWQSSFNWPIAAAGGCCRTRRWVDNVTVTGNQAGANVLETNFWDLEIGGTGTLTNEAFNQIHPFAYIGPNVTISGYAGHFEGSALNDGTVNKFQSAYMLYTNSSAATTGAYTGYTVGATNNNAAAGSMGNFTGYECTGVGGSGSVPTFNWCLVNRDATASIVSRGGIVIGTLANATGPGTVLVQGADNADGTFPITVKNLAGGNQFFMTNNYNATFGGTLTLGTSGSQWGKLFFANLTSGNLQLNAPSSGALSGILTLPNATGTLALTQTYASYQASPGNPTGTTNTTGLMMGLAGAITPSATGKVQITITGTIANATAIADGAKVQIRYGTGTAPVNTAALTGTAVGSLQQYIAATTAETAPFAVSAVVTGLTLSTAYWLDVSLAAITGGTATVTGVSITAIELP